MVLGQTLQLAALQEHPTKEKEGKRKVAVVFAADTRLFNGETIALLVTVILPVQSGIIVVTQEAVPAPEPCQILLTMLATQAPRVLHATAV